MNMSVPIENSEIPQTGLDGPGLESATTEREERERLKMEIKREVHGVVLEHHARGNVLKAHWKTLPSGEYFNYQFYTGNLNPDNTVLKSGLVNICSAELQGVPSGQRVFFRARIVSTLGLGPWSKPVEKRVP